MTRSVLVTEDNPDIAQLIRLHLLEAGFHVTLAHDGRTALSRFEAGVHDFVVLDLMLPDMDGFDVLRQLRAAPSYIPVLILTSRTSDLDRILGLELGADDYLTKPFNVLELVARVKAIFRRDDALRVRREAEDEPVQIGDLHIDRASRRVLLRGREIELTPREFDLLVYFARTPGRVHTRTQLLDSIWGMAHTGYEHTVNSHINRLRAKIEDDPAAPHYVLTVWGVGYKFAGTPHS